MEKNYWLALILSMLILVGYPFLLRKMNPPAPPAETSETLTSEAPGLPAEAAVLAPAAPEKHLAPSVTLYSNKLYDIQFSTLGGSITELIFKGEHERTHLSRVPFYTGEIGKTGNFGLRLLHVENDLTNSIFQLNRKGNSGNIFEFVYEKPGEYRLTKTYTVESDRPVILLDLSIENLSAREKNIPVEFLSALSYEDVTEALRVDVEAVVFQDKVLSKKLDHVKKKGFMHSEASQWSGLIKKYFALIAKPDWKIISSENKADEKNIWVTQRMEPLAVSSGGKVQKQIFIYAGPQRYETMKNLNMDFEQILSKGFFGLFKIWLLVGLKFFNQFTHNFGWAIILMTVALKLAFTPLTHMSYESMRKMQAIQPKMKSIQERYKNDPAKMNREVMELYRRNKVNPMGGCLPMLAQIPVFIAFYQVLNQMIELKGAPFIFWIHDLAEVDRLFSLPFTIPFLGDAFNLLPLFMIVSMVWQQQLTPQAGTSPEQAKMMQFMPVIFGFLFYSMPSGLVLYWFVNNMLTIFHQLVIKRMGAVVLHHEDRD